MSDAVFPKRILYTTSAQVGGSGLDSVALESLRASNAAGILGCALAFGNRQSDIPRARIRSLRWHPVRLLSSLDAPHYYGAKKHYVDWLASRELSTGRYDLFHGWSGECVRTLRVARRLGIPSVIEIPTWHRNKGKIKPAITKTERERAKAGRWRDRLLVTRQQVMEEYDLATRILVLSEKAAETFRVAGVAEEKLFRHSRGVDVERFTPAPDPPQKFVALFVGALIKRKGAHHLIDVWRKLALPDAELWLAGTVHEEIAPWLEHRDGSIRALGFTSKPEELYRAAAVHVFPSECEGSAKCTYEAAACALPQITTREAGDVVEDAVNGLIIPPNDPDSLGDALRRLHSDRELCRRLGTAGRERAVRNFTWHHFRARLLAAYQSACNGWEATAKLSIRDPQSAI